MPGAPSIVRTYKHDTLTASRSGDPAVSFSDIHPFRSLALVVFERPTIPILTA